LRSQALSYTGNEERVEGTHEPTLSTTANPRTAKTRSLIVFSLTC
jgi:hypothetical protein